MDLKTGKPNFVPGSLKKSFHATQVAGYQLGPVGGLLTKDLNPTQKESV
jgi:hypothetical protein